MILTPKNDNICICTELEQVCLADIARSLLINPCLNDIVVTRSSQQQFSFTVNYGVAPLWSHYLLTLQLATTGVILTVI
jgi:hypothetical protein